MDFEPVKKFLDGLNDIIENEHFWSTAGKIILVKDIRSLYKSCFPEADNKEPKIIRYDMIGAVKAGVNSHPQEEVQSMRVEVMKFYGCPISDCVIMEVDKIPENLPEYIVEIKE